MKVIIEIDDDLVQAQVTMLTKKSEDRKNREILMKYVREHGSVNIPEELIQDFGEEFSMVMATAAIGAAAKELDI